MMQQQLDVPPRDRTVYVRDIGMDDWKEHRKKNAKLTQ